MWRIEAIEDTRSYDWNTGRMVPGSGDLRSCDHCGKDHEIHVTIYNPSTKERQVVGSTCAKKLAYNIQSLSASALRLEGMKRAALEIAGQLPKGLRTCDAVEQEVDKYAAHHTFLWHHIFNAYWDRSYHKTS